MIDDLIECVNSDEVSAILTSKKLFIEAITELKNLIELDDVKEVILRQVRFFIMGLLSERQKKIGNEGCHTALYGPPGVGKSKVALILAKIWKSLGILRSRKNEDGDEIKKIPASVISKLKTYFMDLYEFHFHDRRKTALIEKKWDELKKIIQENFDVHCSSHEGNRSLHEGEGEHSTGDHKREHSTGEYKREHSTHKGESESEHSPREREFHSQSDEITDEIKVCGRGDFIADYLGQTSTKVNTFLSENEGKCIIIEEAYTLCQSSSDEYGKEALAILTRWITENPGKNIFIFTGYKKEMSETVFLFQPGLERRFRWVFDIQKYTPNGLKQIFLKQIEGLFMCIDESVNLNKFFEENYEIFSNFGGDTHKLAQECDSRSSDLAWKDFKTGKKLNLMRVLDENLLISSFDSFVKFKHK